MMAESNASSPDQTASSLSPRTVRFRGLPNDEVQAQESVRRIIAAGARPISDVSIFIIPALGQGNKATGLVTFHSGLQNFLDNTTQDSKLVEGHKITFDRHFFGFTQLSRNTDQINADVIAIGGLAGHAYGSWQSRQSPNYMWLRDFLPQDLPSVRVMIHGYSGELEKYDHATLDDYAKELLEDLSLIRGGEAQDRPVVFLAHSFGGIVLERALLLVERDSHSYPNLAPLLQSLRGLMLFAVPHGGMDVNNICQMIGSSDNPRHGLIPYISSNSEKLEAQRCEFKEFVGRRRILSEKFMVYSFYERQQTPQREQGNTGRWKRSETRSFLLTKPNAVLGLPSTMEIPFAVDKDHSEIIKFHSNHDTEYTRVHERLKNLLDPIAFTPTNPSTKQLPENLLPPSEPVSRISDQFRRIDSKNPEEHSSQTPPSLDLGKILIPVTLASAMITVSALTVRNTITWPWKSNGSAFWSIAIPAALFAAVFKYPGYTISSGIQREKSQD